MRSRLAIVVALVSAACVPRPARAADPPTFTVGFADGSRVVGQPIVGWHGVQPQPQCNGRPLFDPGTPARWAVNEQLLSTPDLSGPRIEFTCGDRVFGTVEGWQPGTVDAGVRRPPSLLVRTAVPIERPTGGAATIEVATDFVTRIVWLPRAGSLARPGTIRVADGRELAFRSVRWGADGVLALTADGTERFAFTDMAELAMPVNEPWDDYYRLVAEVAPTLPARLVKVETTTGIVATGSLDPQRGIGDPNDARTWRHVIQPAWSLAPLWLPHAATRRRIFFAAHEPPLTLFPPAAVHRAAAYGGSWTWRSDRNVQGGPLVANGAAGGWGFGVQARCELALSLPAMATGFRTAVALDQVVGGGGCVRTAVHLDAADAKPVWQSPHLVGTRDPVDTGWIGLPRGEQRPRAVVLVADMAHEGRPVGADPHDIRDVVDWLDPVLSLVPEEFAATVTKRIPATVAAWRDCDVEGGFLARIVVDPFRSGESPLLVRQVAVRGDAAISRSLRVTAEQPWLAVGVSRTGASPSRLEIRVDGRSLGVVDVPERVAGQPVRPFFAPLADAVGRTVVVEIVPLAADEQAFVEWWMLGSATAPEPNANALPGTIGVVLGPPLSGLP